MSDPSSPVTSRQREPHPRLAQTVAKHAASVWRKPVADHSRRVFDALVPSIARWSGGLILDTGCGTGKSSMVLGRRYPGSLILGVDKSEARLGRASGDQPSNVLLIRADLCDFWLLAREAGWQFERQCFFYPNPWPKPEHRLRRWPFHPVLPTALACGGIWEVRTNWEIYALEFALAYGQLTGIHPRPEPWAPTEPETLFEKKYLASGHQLWRWEASAGISGSGPTRAR